MTFYQRVKKIIVDNELADDLFASSTYPPARNADIWGDIRYEIKPTPQNRYDCMVYRFWAGEDVCYICFQGVTAFNGNRHILAYYEAEPVASVVEYQPVGLYKTC